MLTCGRSLYAECYSVPSCSSVADSRSSASRAIEHLRLHPCCFCPCRHRSRIRVGQPAVLIPDLQAYRRHQQERMAWRSHSMDSSRCEARIRNSGTLGVVTPSQLLLRTELLGKHRSMAVISPVVADYELRASNRSLSTSSHWSRPNNLAFPSCHSPASLRSGRCCPVS